MHGSNPSDIRTWTIRETYERLYDKTDLTKSTVRTDKIHCDTWERFSGNPPVSEVTNADLLQFKNAMIESGLSPASVNSKLAFLRKVFRVLCPQETGNPTGLGILDRRPHVKPAKVLRKQPRRVSLETLTKFYQATKYAIGPKRWVLPVEWWRSLIVTAFTTGLRRSDLFTLRHDQVDLDKGLLNFHSQKTGKFDAFPLHPVTVNHLKRIWHPVSESRKCLLQAYSHEGCSRFYQEWRLIFAAAGIPESEWFTLHDLRRTGASEIERVSPGMSSTFLQHSPRGVTEESYLNRSDELREAIFAMRLPTGFASGAGMQEKAQARAIQTKLKVRPVDYLAPLRPDPEMFKFEPGRWRFLSSDWFKLTGAKLKLLRKLAAATEPVTIQQIARSVWTDGERPDKWEQSARSRVSEVRSKVCQCLCLPDGFDPIPCVSRSNAAYQLYFPHELFGIFGENRAVDTFVGHPPRDFWRFDGKKYSYRGSEWFTFQGDDIRDLLEHFANAEGIVSHYELAAMFCPDDDPHTDQTRNKIHHRVNKLRYRLRRDLELPESFDPLPHAETVSGGGWVLRMP